jgi:hypothetical protein
MTCGREGGLGSFARTSEDRPPRVLSRITPPVLAGCARAGGPIRATRGGKPSEVARWTRDPPRIHTGYVFAGAVSSCDVQ